MPGLPGTGGRREAPGGGGRRRCKVRWHGLDGGVELVRVAGLGRGAGGLDSRGERRGDGGRSPGRGVAKARSGAGVCGHVTKTDRQAETEAEAEIESCRSRCWQFAIAYSNE